MKRYCDIYFYILRLVIKIFIVIPSVIKEKIFYDESFQCNDRIVSFYSYSLKSDSFICSGFQKKLKTIKMLIQNIFICFSFIYLSFQFIIVYLYYLLLKLLRKYIMTIFYKTGKTRISCMRVLNTRICV